MSDLSVDRALGMDSRRELADRSTRLKDAVCNAKACYARQHEGHHHHTDIYMYVRVSGWVCALCVFVCVSAYVLCDCTC